MIVDFHSHNFPVALAPRALEVMCGKLSAAAACAGRAPLRPAGDGTIPTQLAAMDRAGVDLCVNCPVATRPAQFDAILRRACDVRDGREGAAAAERLVQLGSVHPADPDFAAHVRLLKEYGIPGIKLHPNYQGIRLDDSAWTPFFTALRDAGIFVISHCGFDPGYVDAADAATPARIANLLTAVPGLRFVAAHLGGECGSADHAVDCLLPFPNCRIDTAVMYFREEADEARRIVREWPADRVMFGTDYFWRDQARLRDWVGEIRPDAADCERVFHQNALEWLGRN